MNKYLYLLNWLMAVAIVLTWLYLKPIFGLAVFVGAIIGGMLTAGFVSWQYNKDLNPDKAQAWCSTYFQKQYGKEILVHLGLVIAFLGFALCLWKAPLAFIGGISMMWCLNIIIEAMWHFMVEKWRK